MAHLQQPAHKACGVTDRPHDGLTWLILAITQPIPLICCPWSGLCAMRTEAGHPVRGHAAVGNEFGNEFECLIESTHTFNCLIDYAELKSLLNPLAKGLTPLSRDFRSRFALHTCAASGEGATEPTARPKAEAVKDSSVRMPRKRANLHAALLSQHAADL